MLGSMLDNADMSSGEANPLQRPIADELLRDLLAGSITTTSDIDRRADRLTHNSAVTIAPASTSQRDSLKISGRLRDAGEGGVGVLSDRPPAVGDVYLLKLEDSPFDVEQLFARCIHCRLIQEDTFDSGFVFFTPVTLRNDDISTSSR